MPSLLPRHCLSLLVLHSLVFYLPISVLSFIVAGYNCTRTGSYTLGEECVFLKILDFLDFLGCGVVDFVFNVWQCMKHS